MNNQPNTVRYIPLQDWDKHHLYPDLKQFRRLLFDAEENGLDKVVFKVRGLILVDEAAFFEWVRSHPYKNTRKKGRPRKIDKQSNKEEDQSTG